MSNRILRFTSRWPVKQLNERVVEVHVPLGDGPQLVNPDFVRAHELSDREQDMVEDAALQAIAWLPQ